MFCFFLIQLYNLKNTTIINCYVQLNNLCRVNFIPTIPKKELRKKTITLYLDCIFKKIHIQIKYRSLYLKQNKNN